MNAEQRKIIALSRLELADRTLQDADLLIGHGSLRSAANRLYYALFYAVNALACAYNFKTSRHSSLRAWFNKEVIKSGLIEKEIGAIYNKVFELRTQGDYEDLYLFKKDTVDFLLKAAPAFILTVRRLTLEWLEKNKS